MQQQQQQQQQNSNNTMTTTAALTIAAGRGRFFLFVADFLLVIVVAAAAAATAADQPAAAATASDQSAAACCFSSSLRTPNRRQHPPRRRRRPLLARHSSPPSSVAVVSPQLSLRSTRAAHDRGSPPPHNAVVPSSFLAVPTAADGAGCRAGSWNCRRSRRMAAPEGDGGSGSSGDSSGASGGGGGLDANNDNSVVGQALGLINKGAKFCRELDSYSDPAAEEREADRQLEKEERQQRAGNEEKPKEGIQQGENNNLIAGLMKREANSTTDDNKELKELKELMDRKLAAFDRRARRTRIVLLRRVAAWAYGVCCERTGGSGDDGTGSKSNKKKGIDPAEFYSGVLLVHLHLAKYVGVAATNPPTRSEMQELFELADQDQSGYLNQDEFTDAVVVACAPVAGRIAVYWSLLGFLPVLVSRTMGGVAHLMRRHVDRLPPSLSRNLLAAAEWTVEHAFSLAFFSILVPFVFGKMDRAVRHYARKRAKRRNKDSSSLWWLKIRVPYPLEHL